MVQKYKANGTVKPTRVVVKTERDLEQQLGIKQESRNSQCANSMPNSDSLKLGTTWGQEKKTLIDKIASLKSENQKLSFDFKKSQDDLATCVTAKKALEIKAKRSDEIHLKELTRLRAEQSQLVDASKRMKTDLTRERELSEARYKQLQNAITQQKPSEEVNQKENNNTEEYEVDCLIDDRMVPRTREYLVRWKGYDSSHDSWVKEKDLECPSILKKYKSAK